MLELTAVCPKGGLQVLCIGAHCDDIEIGCGGTLLALQQLGLVSRIDWVVLSSNELRQQETRAAMERLVEEPFRGELVFGTFPDGVMPGHYAAVKDFFEALKGSPDPTLIFTHARDDRHQDHRIACEMTWNTFRDHLILEYEIPKWDGGLGQPNVYVPLSRIQVNVKIDALLGCHCSQAARDWFTRDAFEAILRLRGIECRAPSGYAEAFVARKLLLSAA